ncbi:MAG: hypothetical protein KDD52_05875 [Bdellovibrionales bacterium]|nr:hypothetical protein [Bdellovibrionales bacterium]
MNRIFSTAVFFVLMLSSSLAHAYFGVKAGLVDEDNFGYGIVGGIDLPLNLAVDASLVGFYKKDGANTQDAWMQGDLDALYDLGGVIGALETLNLHPYVKGGFSYGALFIERPVLTELKASHGAGFNVGGGVDWKVGPVTVGVDVTQSFIFLNGISVNNVQVSDDEMAKVLNVMAQVKLFAY